MRRLVWMLVVLAACEKASAPAAGSAGSAGSGDPAIDQFMADFQAYGEKAVPMLAKFNGDCGAIADQMLTLEPLAQKIRKEAGAIEEVKLRKRTAEYRDKVTRHYEELAKSLGMTTADIDNKEAELKAKCSDDPKWKDAIERTGLMQKKSK